MKKKNRFVENYSSWTLNNKYKILIVSLLVAFAVGSGGRYLAFNSSYKVFFGKSNPLLDSFESMQNIYSKSDGVLFVLAPKNGKVFDRPFLSSLEEITTKAWQVPYSYRVDSITNFQHISADEEGIKVNDLIENAAVLSDFQIAAAKDTALNEPLLINRLITKKADVTAVNVMVRIEDGNSQKVFGIAKFCRQLKDEIEKSHPDIEVHLTGVAMLSNAFAEVSMQDLSTLMPIMYFVILILTFFVLRSLSGTFAAMLVIMCSTMVAMGFAGYAGIQLNPVNANAPVIVLTLSIADSIHVLLSFLKLLRQGKDKRTALKESLQNNFKPMVLTSVTTSIGFLGLNMSDSPPFHDLGNMTAVGVMAALIFSLFLLPAIICILPIKSTAQAPKISMSRISGFVIAHQKTLLWGVGVFSLLMTGMLFKLYINDNYIEYFKKGIDIRDSTDFTNQHLTGIYTMEFSIESGEKGGISNPQYLKKVDAFAAWLRKHDEVKNVQVITDTLKRLNKSMHGDMEQWYKLPDSKDLAAQYLLLYEMSLPLGLDLNNEINLDKSASKMTVTLADMGTSEMQRMKADSERWLRNNTPAPMHAVASSAALVFSYVSISNAKGMIMGTCISLILISLILILAFRSWKYGLLSIIPNAIPIVLTMGIWACIDGEIGVAATTVGSMTIGIIVDSTIYIISKYTKAINEINMNPEEAVHYAISTVGLALFATCMILITGFGILSTSSFKMNMQMGILSALTLIIATIIDFIFTPSLLLAVDQKAMKIRTSEDLIVSDTGNYPINLRETE